MTAAAVARSSFETNLKRYSRSWGLWLLLLVGPVGARYMIGREEGAGVRIAIDGHLPVMTSAVLGVSLGIVVSTLLLPIGFLYLRSNTNRRQPWQVEEVTAASRVFILLGRFGADVAVLLGLLTALTLAGWFLGWLVVTGPLNVGEITLGLWMVAAPALIGVCAVHQLFAAVPWLRRGLGEFAFFILWIMSIAMPAAADGLPSSFASNMVDFPGFVRPLVAGSPAAADGDFAIGGIDLKPGRIPLDVMRGLGAPGYAESRIAWIGVALLTVIFAGLVYRPHTARRPPRLARLLARISTPGRPQAADPAAPPAPHRAWPFAGLILAEFRLIGAGRLFLALAGASAVLGLFGEFRHTGSAAQLLLLIFGLTAHAGRSEAKGLAALAGVAPLPPIVRRLAFLLAGMGWAFLLAIPAAVYHLSLEPLLLGIATGAAAAVVASTLALVSRTAFAPRLVLLILWYAYLSA